MKNNYYQRLTTSIFILTAGLGWAQTNLDVNLSNNLAKIQPTMYGIFFEDINFAADGGLYAELVKNRSFEFDEPFMGWSQPKSDRHSLNEDSGFAQPVNYNENAGNQNYLKVTVNNPAGYELYNEGFRGMGLKAEKLYKLSLKAKKNGGDIRKIKIELLDTLNKVLAATAITPDATDWKTYTAQLKPTRMVSKGKLKLTFEGTGEIDLDMISLFPKDTWKGRKNGLRKDLVQLLADLKPGFLRFPGGCIVEGRTLAKRYQWKNTVGPVADRVNLINRWNTEFSYKLTPDYFQSFGLGFFEYFQLAEDIGATPLPILSCGIACQFNTGELVPMEELDPYVQDALDLIEFANGGTDTPWGKVRADMGHPAPFNIKYIGVGNEQWGPEYIARYKVFDKKISEKYPDIVIVSGSGPFPNGESFDYGTKELTQLGAKIIDEHYYKSPEWFRENATRYDNYDRNGPKVFAGEYAAHPKGVEDGPKENNWEAALSEAAFMTGLERNADVVTMTSYAPLMANINAWQWAPDLIWFNNLDSYGTANYQVQKLFSTNSGTDLVSITSQGKALTGQHNLYATAVTDAKTGTAIVKLVNTAKDPQEVKLNFKGKKLNSEGQWMLLANADLTEGNSFKTPQNISPEAKKIEVHGAKASLKLPGYSVNVIKIDLNQ